MVGHVQGGGMVCGPTSNKHKPIYEVDVEQMQQGSMLSTSLWLYKNVPYKRHTIFPLDESIVYCHALVSCVQLPPFHLPCLDPQQRSWVTNRDATSGEL
jgi:hypothetical protein